MTEFNTMRLSDIHWGVSAPLNDLALWGIPPARALCSALDNALEDDDTGTAIVLVNAIVVQLDALEKALNRLEDEHREAKREANKETPEEKTMKELELDVDAVATSLKICVKSFEAMGPRLAILEKGKPELKEAA